MLASNVAAFKAAILADVNLATQRAAGDHGAIAAYYNAPGTGLIWRPNITTDELNTAIIWSEFAGLTALLQNTYLAMIAGTSVDATKANIRGGFSTVFAGKTSLTNLNNLAQRVPTRFEQLFTTAQVSTEYATGVNVADVALALGS